MKSKKTKQFASSFWYKQPDFSTDRHSVETTSDMSKLIQLAASKRAISNFVRIVVPDRTIKTVFNGSQSYTDGNSVVIGADVDNISKFDSAVGLALHEAAHIKLSDFQILKNLESSIEGLIGQSAAHMMYENSEKVGIYRYQVGNYIKEILNYVEDRRIDQYIYDTAPGYRDYYQALYDTYFNDKVITKALQSSEYTDESYDSYSFRLINLHADGSRLNALKGLPAIWNVLDLRNIGRLKSSSDALVVALAIYNIIIQNLTPQPSTPSQNTQSSDSNEGSEKSQSSSSSSSAKGNNTDNTESESDDSDSEDDVEQSEVERSGQSSESEETTEGSSESEETEETTESGETEETTEEEPEIQLTPAQRAKIGKQLQKQRDFLNGDIRKKKMSKSDEATVQSIEQSGAEVIEVGGTDGVRKMKSILIRKVSAEFAQSREFPFYNGYDGYANVQREWISKGVRLGKRLSGKLQMRADERNTEYNRLRSGKIDRKMLAMLGAGKENVFFTTSTDKYNKANLHISLDGSSSMRGTPWYQAVMTTVALIKAIEEIPNLDVQVSIRGTRYVSRTDTPVVAVVYDSRVDKFQKVLKMFPHFTPSGTTPEGLTFETIMNELVGGSGNVDSYFLNMSDGMPYVSGVYEGQYARRHTQKQVQNMRGRGIKVLSYLISDTSYYMTEFREMYGTSAKSIDVESITQIARTMNEMFLSKD
jgi:hypothetical protein